MHTPALEIGTPAANPIDLVEEVVQWAHRQGLREFASDALLHNTDAHAVHRALGFEETERVVYFRRALPDSSDST